MRLFAAVWPTDEVRAAIAGTVQRMREHSDAGAWRWVRAEHWHVTLAFYGTVAEAQVPELTRRLTVAGRRRRPFDLQFGDPGRFGDRVVWLGLDGDREELRRLAAGCAAAGRRSGVAMEDRRFRPHLTLARSRSGGDCSGLLAVQSPPQLWPVDSFALVRSQPGPQVRYDTVAEFSLDGG